MGAMKRGRMLVIASGNGFQLAVVLVFTVPERDLPLHFPHLLVQCLQLFTEPPDQLAHHPGQCVLAVLQDLGQMLGGVRERMLTTGTLGGNSFELLGFTDFGVQSLFIAALMTGIEPEERAALIDALSAFIILS